MKMLVVAALIGAVSLDIAGPWPLAVIARLPLLVPAASATTMEADGGGKAQFPLADKEYVVIGGQRFEVCSPWFGHRIEVMADRGKPEFVMLPKALALEDRKIYVTVATRDAFVKMAAAAAADGVELLVDSGYRSVAYQRQIYQRKLAEGDAFADIARGVAPPGYSEHMLGTTLDLVPSKWTFNGTPAEKWLLANGGAFAFVQSYPQKSERGFTWEPWHWKYVGDS